METTKCPFCFEVIQVGAKKCKHCGEILDSELRVKEQKSKGGGVNTTLLTILVVLAIGALLVYLMGF